MNDFDAAPIGRGSSAKSDGAGCQRRSERALSFIAPENETFNPFQGFLSN